MKLVKGDQSVKTGTPSEQVALKAKGFREVRAKKAAPKPVEQVKAVESKPEPEKK